MSQEIRDGLLHEINPILVAEVDAFADMLEQRNLARDCAITLEQELAAAEAENKRLTVGAADNPGPDDSYPTPAQFIRRSLDADEATRLRIAEAFSHNAQMSSACFMQDHERQLLELRTRLNGGSL